MPFQLSLQLPVKLKPRYIHSHAYLYVYASALDRTATAKKVVYKWASSLWIASEETYLNLKLCIHSLYLQVLTTFKKCTAIMCVQFSLVLDG